MRTSAVILTALAIALSGPAFSQAAATPALRIKAVIDNARNADTPAAQLLRIRNRLLIQAAPGVDTSAWTAVQKDVAVLAWMQATIKRGVLVGADQAERAAVAATVTANTNTAAADMD